ncbi:unnamed protein product [Orchesella dallaii]|uniref:Arrestin C-terminal-like domain-containing protein n=1 Tax=Orchesella dallaii TaxID=48710 RepID=A0ABP1S2E3_9HEXA
MDLRIELDNSTKFDSAENILSRNGYYEPGGLISGKVIVINRTLKPLDIHKGLAITFIGKVWVWTTASVEIFFTEKIELIRSFTDSGQRNPSKARNLPGPPQIPPGLTTYRFNYQFPLSLPSSFKGRFGKVEYYADVSLSTILYEKRVTLPFILLAIKDLNLDASATRSAKILIEKHICCFCCRSGPIRLSFWVPRKGCVPGGYLQFCVKIWNYSPFDLRRATVSLIQEATTICGNNSSGHRNQLILSFGSTSEMESKVVCRMKGPSVKAGEHKIWTVDNFPVPVPSIPPTNLESFGCLQYITIQYILQIKVRPRKPILSCLSTYSSIYGGIPVVVGTVPLYSQTSSSLPHEDSTTCLITDEEDDDENNEDDEDGEDDDEEDDCSSSSDVYMPTSDSSTAICSGRTRSKNLIRRSTNRLDSAASTSSSIRAERSSSSVSLSIRKQPENLKDTPPPSYMEVITGGASVAKTGPPPKSPNTASQSNHGSPRLFGSKIPGL